MDCRAGAKVTTSSSRPIAANPSTRSGSATSRGQGSPSMPRYCASTCDAWRFSDGTLRIAPVLTASVPPARYRLITISPPFVMRSYERPSVRRHQLELQNLMLANEDADLVAGRVERCGLLS